MGWLNAAFNYAFSGGGENLVGPRVAVDEIVVRNRGREEGRGSLLGPGARAAIALDRLQVLGRITAFGMNVREYIHWRNTLAAAPHLNIKNELIAYGMNDPPWSDEDYEAAVAYVVDSVLRMEQVVDDVDPGGFKRGGFDKL